MKTYRVELNPTQAQAEAFERHFDAARFAYNWGLERCLAAKNEGGISIPGYVQLSRELNAEKKQSLGWLYQTSHCASQNALVDLDDAVRRFFRQKGNKFPRFKSRKRDKRTYRVSHGRMRFGEGNRLHIPRIGEVRIKEKGYLPQESRITRISISGRAGKYFASILFEKEEHHVQAPSDGPVLGVDLGMRTSLVTSQGRSYANPRGLRRHLARISRLDRSLSRSVQGSARWQKKRLMLAKEHYHIACIRKDAAYKSVADLLSIAKPAEMPSVLVLECLCVPDMLRGKGRAFRRAAQDAAMGQLRAILEYKARWHGITLLEAPAFFPSSKRCCSCHVVNSSLRLEDVVFRCPHCGEETDRDLNAARNLAALAAGPAESINAHGAVLHAAAMKWDAAAAAGQTSRMTPRFARKEALGVTG